jgi:hypothetical protein
MGRWFDIPWVVGVDIPWEGIDIPWVVVVDIPWVAGVDIPWVWGSIYQG